jgi:hypothetical protein
VFVRDCNYTPRSYDAHGTARATYQC